MRHPYRSVLITGASSGIGEALAFALANSDVSLALTGRDENRLRIVADEVEKMGAGVLTAAVDVTDSQAMADFVASANGARPLDLVIANAGISGGAGAGSRDLAASKAIIDVNVTGVMNTVLPAAEAMRPRARGQIAIVSSIVGFRGMPTAPAYSTSKVAVDAWGRAIRPSLVRDGLTLSIIYPGFVKSRITDQNTFKMPFFMQADRAADIIIRGLVNHKDHIAFPWQSVLTMRTLSVLPQPVFDWIMSKAPKKG